MIECVDPNDFLAMVRAEIERARIKFPSSRLCVVALMEEVGELAQACLKVAAGKPGWSRDQIVEEAVQVATMAARVALEGDPSFIGYTEPDDRPKPTTIPSGGVLRR